MAIYWLVFPALLWMSSHMCYSVTELVTKTSMVVLYSIVSLVHHIQCHCFCVTLLDALIIY